MPRAHGCARAAGTGCHYIVSAWDAPHGCAGTIPPDLLDLNGGDAEERLLQATSIISVLMLPVCRAHIDT